MDAPRKISRAGIILIAAAIFAGVVASLDMSGGPISQSSGVVQSVALIPNDTGPSEQVVSVLLSNGSFVQAKVMLGRETRPGQEVNVNVYRRVFSGTSTYEVIGSREAK